MFKSNSPPLKETMFQKICPCMKKTPQGKIEIGGGNEGITDNKISAGINQNREAIAEENKINARANWAKLRQKVKETKHEANWLVQQLDKKKEKAQQNMQGLEIDEIKQQ